MKRKCGRAGSTATCIITGIFALMMCGNVSHVRAEPGMPPPGGAEIAARLTAAYPGIVKGVEGNDVIFTDGTKMPLDDGKGFKSAADWLENPDIKDMFRHVYPAGAAFIPPDKDFDPGRARNEAFFTHVYGDCRKGVGEKNLVTVVWLPKKWGAKLPFSKINGAAEHLKAVSEDLDKLPERFNAYLFPTAGTYNCRVVAGTKALSAHGLGIAIDISLKHSSYWRWFLGKPGGDIKYRNAIPLEIVNVFEKHGFIWGGRWSHFDTMHFEYRPELIGSEPVGSGPAAPALDQPK
jgi:D-alanyl-D-alanine carboxypeptidase